MQIFLVGGTGCNDIFHFFDGNGCFHCGRTIPLETDSQLPDCYRHIVSDRFTFLSFGYSIWSDFTIFHMQFLDFFDYISNNIMMPIVALMTCVLVGFVSVSLQHGTDIT